MQSFMQMFTGLKAELRAKQFSTGESGAYDVTQNSTLKLFSDEDGFWEKPDAHAFVRSRQQAGITAQFDKTFQIWEEVICHLDVVEGYERLTLLVRS